MERRANKQGGHVFKTPGQLFITITNCVVKIQWNPVLKFTFYLIKPLITLEFQKHKTNS